MTTPALAYRGTPPRTGKRHQRRVAERNLDRYTPGTGKMLVHIRQIVT